jgi:hypothetical protein
MKQANHRVPPWIRVVLMEMVFVSLVAQSAGAGDTFFRGGMIFHPRDIGFEGRWRANFGNDYAVNFAETIFLGFELQTSVYRADVFEQTATVVPTNGFVNVKVKSSKIGLRPYGGGGMGLLSNFVFVSGGLEWGKNFGFQLLGGIEIGRLSLELQMQRAFESRAQMSWGAYAGLIF